MYDFKSKTQPTNTKRCYITRSTNGYVWFLKVLFFHHQNSKFQFLKNKWSQKTKILKTSKKRNRYMLQSYVLATGVQNFEPISLFSAVQWPKNEVRVMTTLFWNSIFGILRCRTTKQTTCLESLDKIRQDRYIKKWFQNLTVFDPNLT